MGELKKVETEEMVRGEESRMLMENLIDIRSIEGGLYLLNLQTVIK